MSRKEFSNLISFVSDQVNLLRILAFAIYVKSITLFIWQLPEKQMCFFCYLKSTAKSTQVNQICWTRYRPYLWIVLFEVFFFLDLINLSNLMKSYILSERMGGKYNYCLLMITIFHLSSFFIISLLVIYKLSTFHFIPHTSRVHSTVYIKLVQWTAVPLFVLKYYSKLTFELKCTNWWVVVPISWYSKATCLLQKSGVHPAHCSICCRWITYNPGMSEIPVTIGRDEFQWCHSNLVNVSTFSPHNYKNIESIPS